MNDGTPSARAALLRHYAATRYVVIEGFTMIVGRLDARSIEFDRLLERRGVVSAVLVTAWNPGSVAAPEQVHGVAARRLRTALAVDGRPFLPHLGLADDGGWREEGVLALGLDVAQGVKLALRFGQHAIVHVQRHEPLALVTTPLMPPA